MKKIILAALLSAVSVNALAANYEAATARAQMGIDLQKVILLTGEIKDVDPAFRNMQGLLLANEMAGNLDILAADFVNNDLDCTQAVVRATETLEPSLAPSDYKPVPAFLKAKEAFLQDVGNYTLIVCHDLKGE